MNNVNIEKAISYAWARLKANPAFYILGLVITVLVSTTLTSLVVGPLAFASLVLNIFSAKVSHLVDCLAALLLFVMKCLVFAPLLVGYLKGIRREAEGETASIADLFSGFRDYPSVVVFSAVMGCLLAIGFAFFVVPGLLLCPVLSMGLYYLSEGVTGSYGIDAIIKAFKNWSIGLELFILVVLAASFLSGLVLCCVGVVLTVPLGVTAVWHLCRQFSDGQDAAPAANPQDEQIGTPS